MSKRDKKKKSEPKTDEVKPEVEEKPQVEEGAEEIEPTEEEKVEEEKPVEVKKEEKPKKKKGKKARLSTLYDYDYEKNLIKLKNKKCPRCGNIMALHKSPTQRWTCGSCSYTEYVKKEENEASATL